MGTTATEHYRQHAVWDALRMKAAALEAARYSTPAAEDSRSEWLWSLQHALQSEKNPTPYLYDDVLDGVRDSLNNLVADEASFTAFVQAYAPSLRDAIRRLPGPPPRQVNDRYLAALDSAIAAREDELADLRTSVGELSTDIAGKKDELVRLSKAVQAQTDKIAADAATISQTTANAATELRSEWTTELGEWQVDRKVKDEALNKEMAEQVGLLTVAAAVGQRLVEHAAGQLTATEWTKRSSRERRNALWLRWGSIVAFVLALLVGGYILWTAIEKGFTLTIGDGILRGALVLALVGVGSFLTAEARRHFREADSAEDVALTMVAIEPFYAGASDSARASVREAVGDTVFVRNILSRFLSRDATKHAAVTNAQLSEMVDLLSKGADLAKKADPGQ